MAQGAGEADAGGGGMSPETLGALASLVAWMRYCDAHAGISRYLWGEYREEEWR